VAPPEFSFHFSGQTGKTQFQLSILLNCIDIQGAGQVALRDYYVYPERSPWLLPFTDSRIEREYP
jgi:hypothetical protein